MKKGHIHLLNGERISIQEFRKIPQFFYIGGQDTNDASETCFYEGGNDITPNQFGNTAVERWSISEELYKTVDRDSEFRVYKDIGSYLKIQIKFSIMCETRIIAL